MLLLVFLKLKLWNMSQTCAIGIQGPHMFYRIRSHICTIDQQLLICLTGLVPKHGYTLMLENMHKNQPHEKLCCDRFSCNLCACTRATKHITQACILLFTFKSYFLMSNSCAYSLSLIQYYYIPYTSLNIIGTLLQTN